MARQETVRADAQPLQASSPARSPPIALLDFGDDSLVLVLVLVLVW
ncbi:hypothetical protein [Orlajensenia leifsoniae]|nr:hypothetical protein [Leifsonia flava]